MDRLSVALRLMLVFAGCLGAAILVASTRPAADPGVLPWVVQSTGYACGLLAGVLVLTSRAPGGAAAPVGRTGVLLLAGVLALVLLDVVVAATSSGGAGAGAGLLRLLLLLGIGLATVRLARAVADRRRSR